MITLPQISSHRPVRRHGFTLIELLVVISIIALLIGILLPALGAARRTARQMANNTHLRGMHQGFFTFAQENKGFYPGLFGNIGNGKEVLGSADFFAEIDGVLGPASGVGNSGNARARIGLLVVNDFIPAEYAISPAENDDRIVPWLPGTAFDEEQNSYSLLRIGNGNQGPHGLREEWSDTANGQAVIASDRDTARDADNPESLHTEEGSGEWKGGVVWNDGHVGFEQDAVMDTTRYAKQTNTDDQLFTQTETAAGDDENSNTQMKTEEPQDGSTDD